MVGRGAQVSVSVGVDVVVGVGVVRVSAGVDADAVGLVRVSASVAAGCAGAVVLGGVGCRVLRGGGSAQVGRVTWTWLSMVWMVQWPSCNAV